MIRAVIYARLSRDDTGTGRGGSILDQLERGRALAQSRGWDAVAEYVDGGVSAADEGKRPQFDAMMCAVAEGRADAVIARHWDRLSRNRRESVQVIETLQRFQTRLAFLDGMDLDLTTAQGRMFADQQASWARAEIEFKSERQKAANRRRALNGELFTTRRPFGYCGPRYSVIHEAEAEAIRGAYSALLSGGSLREVARRWNDANLLTPQKGKPWTGTLVRQTLQNPRLAGWRTYKGKYDKSRPVGQKWVGGFYDSATNPLAVVRGANGDPVTAEWPPIIDADTFYAVSAILRDPARRTTPTHFSQLLLSGVARCADCGAVIQSGGKRNGRSRYRCSVKGGHVYREAQPVDEYVELLVLRRLAEPDLLEYARPKGPEVDITSLRQEVNDLHARMDGLAEAFADGVIDASALRSGTERARTRLAEVEARMPTTDGTSGALAELVTARDLLVAWERLGLDSRRAVIDALVTVRLTAPGTKENAYRWDHGQRKVNPETVLVEWK